MIGGADRLAIEDRRRRRRLSAAALMIGKHEGVMDVLPHAFLLPAAQIIVDRLPRRQVMRQQPLGRTGSQKVENRVYQLA